MLLFKRIKTVFIICFFFVSANVLFAQADYGSTIEIIYSNLNIINNSIYSIKNQMKSLEGSLQKQLKAHGKSVEENKLNTQANTKDITTLKTEMRTIDTAYQKVMKKYEEIIANMDDVDYKLLRVDSSFVDLNQELDDLRNKFIFLTTEYFELKNQFVKIPEIMFCQNCKPKIFFGLNHNQYLFDPNSDIAVEPSFSLECGYNYNNNFSIWLNYNFPFFVTVSEDEVQNLKLSDKWKSNILTLGVSYNFLEDRNFEFRFGGGFYYGSATYDKFNNDDSGFFREESEDVSSVGFNAKFELSYNEFYSKIPLEVFVSANTLFALEKITMNPGLSKSFDLGNSLFYVSLGIKFNFWRI
ncbi:MAG: hypothetical protein V1779_10835 [bacterium]